MGLLAKPGTVRWGLWDGSLPPVLTIRSGDTVTIDTLSGEPEDMPDPPLGFTIVPGHREVLDAGHVGPGPHFLTGPIQSKAPSPATCSKSASSISSSRQDWGWNLQVPLRGTLPEDFPELRRLHVPLDRKNNLARMPWGQDLALEPFFGNFGVAPPLHWGRLSSKEPRVFGGNMDNKELRRRHDRVLSGLRRRRAVLGRRRPRPAGRRRGLPDRHRDRPHRHVRVHRAHRHEARSSRARETPDVWITMGFDEDLDDAVKQALRDMIKLIGELSGLSPQDAYTLCSIAADLRVTQTVDGNKGIHCVLAKSKLPARR